jgi:hypothetical protein
MIVIVSYALCKTEEPTAIAILHVHLQTPSTSMVSESLDFGVHGHELQFVVSAEVPRREWRFLIPVYDPNYWYLQVDGLICVRLHFATVR